jgi:hypothetical protein
MKSDKAVTDRNVKGKQAWGQPTVFVWPPLVILKAGAGGGVTVRIAASLATIPKELLTTTVNLVPLSNIIFVRVRVALVAAKPMGWPSAVQR